MQSGLQCSVYASEAPLPHALRDHPDWTSPLGPPALRLSLGFSQMDHHPILGGERVRSRGLIPPGGRSDWPHLQLRHLHFSGTAPFPDPLSCSRAHMWLSLGPYLLPTPL